MFEVRQLIVGLVQSLAPLNRCPGSLIALNT
jgi:hypothetical protein